MKVSGESETNQAGYEKASNSRMSSWLINEWFTPGAGLEPGSGSGGKLENLTKRPELAAVAMKHKHTSHWGDSPSAKTSSCLGLLA